MPGISRLEDSSSCLFVVADVLVWHLYYLVIVAIPNWQIDKLFTAVFDVYRNGLTGWVKKNLTTIKLGLAPHGKKGK